MSLALANGQPDDVALETLHFEDLGDDRTRLNAQSLVDSFEGRDQWLASGMETSVEQGYAGAWRSQTDAVQALLDDPDTAEREHDLPHIGRMPLGQAIDMIYTSDVFLHRWDLARATGQDETLDPDKCAAMLDGMLPMDDVLRQSGQYGPRVEVADDADIQTKLLAFIGRTP